MASAQPESVPISSLSIEELARVHDQIEQELQTYMQNMVALQQTAARFANAGQSVEYLQDQKPGQPVMLPLTESLYVSGNLESVDSVLLDIGTGYFVERDLKGGEDYCRRKVLLLKDKMGDLGKLIQTRQAMKQQLLGTLEQKSRQAQQQQKQKK